MRTILAVALLLIAIVSAAQADTIRNVKADSLYYKKPFFRIYPVIMNNGEKLIRGEAGILFRRAPEAFLFYKKYRSRYKVGAYSFAGFFIFTAVSVLGFENNNKGLAATGLTLSFASFINSIVFISFGEASLDKTIRLYNQQYTRF